MDILDNAINQRIMSGSFPTDKLFPSSIEEGRVIDFLAQAGKGLEVLRQNPDLFYVLFVGFCKKVQELDSLGRPECYIQGVNYLINAKYTDDYLRVNGSLQTAFNLCPVVTTLDKVLWFGAYAFYMEIELNQDVAQLETTSMMYAWIYLLDIAQKWELRSGNTIEISAVKPSTRIFDIISGTYEERRFRGCSRKLTKNEYAGLCALTKSRNELSSEIQEEIRVAEDVSEKTGKEWAIFLQVINDLSEREAVVIRKIINAVSAKDKIRAIQEYYAALRDIERGHYYLNGTEIELIPLLEAVNERMDKASTFAAACTGDGIPFRVHPALFSLAINPRTYNFLFISFHHFRLAPSKETAKRFVSLALTCIKRNLGGEDHEWVSLNDMIEDFYTTVFSFMRENSATIKNLSFDKLLADVVAVDSSSLESIEASEMFKESWSEKIRAYTNSKAYEEDIENLIRGKTHTLGIKDILAQVSEAESEISQLENEASARRIVVSLNIIYLFCDALRIMLSSQHGNIKLKSPDTIEKYRRDLLKLDDELVHTVYAHLDAREIGMLEYREKSGVFSFTLSEQEAQEEAYRNAVFSDILKRSIEGLTTGIETQNVDQLIETNTQIRAEILRYPDCDEKEYYAVWLDSISGRICSALVENCKKQKDDYQAIKQNILNSLGPKSSILPASTVDSLTTAEMLYARYATTEYAQEGFDFSCISALYYQAFEDAYNDLIWRRYATMLNGLVINGVNYTDILVSFYGISITDPDAKGYLDDNNSKQRDYYVKYKKKGKTITQARVDLRCMYKSFANIMKNIINPSKLNGFCEYFAKLTGFSGSAEMFADTPFMKKCCDFALAIDQSADNRNNASHGGSFISVQQCSDDKKVVLNNLEKVRSSSIGLVQQLLYILQKD